VLLVQCPHQKFHILVGSGSRRSSSSSSSSSSSRSIVIIIIIIGGGGGVSSGRVMFRNVFVRYIEFDSVNRTISMPDI